MTTTFFDDDVLSSPYLSEHELDILADWIRGKFTPIIGDFRLERGKTTISKFYPIMTAAGPCLAEETIEIERDTVRRYYFINEGEKIGCIDIVLGKNPNQSRVRIYSLPGEQNIDSNLSLLREFTLRLIGNLEIIANNKVIKTLHKTPPGKPHFQEDVWAHHEVVSNGREKSIVKSEWLLKVEENNLKRSKPRRLLDSERQFANICRPDFLERKGKYL